MPPVQRIGEQVEILGPVPSPMDWQQADALARALGAAARSARRVQWRRENRCVDCGGQLEPGHEGDTCGPACLRPDKYDVHHPLAEESRA